MAARRVAHLVVKMAVQKDYLRAVNLVVLLAVMRAGQKVSQKAD